MGMYTELVLGLEVENNDKVIQTLRYMLDETEYEPEWDHEFFRTSRWDYMLKCDSYYFAGQTDNKLIVDDLMGKHGGEAMYYLNVRCNLKNYGDEIDKFLDWLCPYIKTEGFLGYKRYETEDSPTLIYKLNNKIDFVEVKNG